MITNVKPHTNIKDAINESVGETCFAYKDQRRQQVSSGDRLCIAKHIHTVNQFMESDKYYLMCGRNGLLYNPFDAPFQRSRMLGSDFFQWKKTTNEAFDLYLKFLDTQNTVYFDRADKITSIGE